MQKEVEAVTSSGHTKKKKRIDPQSIVDRFVACPRCSVFLVGYRLINEDLDAALDANEGGRIHLTWNSATRKLLQKCYGVEISQDVTDLEAICSGCYRWFSVTAGDGEEPPKLILSVKPIR